ncbi:TlyA family RNA methyltransferase [Beijerinckia sp. L45]|uniref:TlyA family RNA methyltransferase n=1 Tax=Beijerinckia sp. L45 TaxID=1641855 RepID=UPI00131B2317|nr:TlyA family RNA methyltransferase [Beijerinckia sp. L45]
MPQRIDLLLVARGLFESRAKAQEAIAAGLVLVGGRVVAKPSEKVADDAAIDAEAPYPWVSRGGVKLAAALDTFGYDPAGRTCLDVGASTGGFTHVLLTRGASRVHAIDVGQGQLHPSLLADPRVISREKQDARLLDADDFAEKPAAITCDVSFISLALVLPSVLKLAANDAWLVALIKPQFEVGPALVTKGLVKDAFARDKAVRAIKALVETAGWRVEGIIPSPIAGGDGNLEYLIGARMTSL